VTTRRRIPANVELEDDADDDDDEDTDLFGNALELIFDPFSDFATTSLLGFAFGFAFSSFSTFFSSTFLSHFFGSLFFEPFIFSCSASFFDFFSFPFDVLVFFTFGLFLLDVGATDFLVSVTGFVDVAVPVTLTLFFPLPVITELVVSFLFLSPLRLPPPPTEAPPEPPPLSLPPFFPAGSPLASFSATCARCHDRRFVATDLVRAATAACNAPLLFSAASANAFFAFF